MEEIVDFATAHDALSFKRSSPSPLEFVVTTEHIVENIFGHCGRATLLNARLVSYSWSLLASKELLKVTSLSFRRGSLWNHEPRSTLFCTKTPNDPTLTVDRLVTDMRGARGALSDSRPTLFPIHSFAFLDSRSIGHPVAQDFLDEHGSSIERLVVPEIFFEDFQRILMSQTPNLLDFGVTEILFQPVSALMGTEVYRDLDYLVPEGEVLDRKCFSLFEDRADGSEGIFQLSLEQFTCKYEMPESILREILDHSFQLKTVDVFHHNYYQLLRPLNRLHLLNNTVISVDEVSVDALEMIARHLESQPTKSWAACIRSIRVLSQELFHPCSYLREVGAAVMSKILKMCAPFCVNLEWTQCRFLTGLEIPQMPRVKQLTLLYSPQQSSVLQGHFFPPLHKLSDIFPNLQVFRIKIRGYSLSRREMWEFFDSSQLECVLPSVQHVYLGSQLCQRFPKEIFPNAKLHYTYAFGNFEAVTDICPDCPGSPADQQPLTDVYLATHMSKWSYLALNMQNPSSSLLPNM